MSGCKESNAQVDLSFEGKGYNSGPPLAVDVTKVDISPNPAPLCDPLRLKVEFTLDRPLREGEWLIKVGNKLVLG
ncbi:hypothetical protein ABG067_002544 [Albugo candida]